MIQNPMLLTRTIIAIEDSITATHHGYRESADADLSAMTRREREIVFEWFRLCRVHFQKVAGTPRYLFWK